MSANNLRELLIDEMKDIYDAEHRITKALPKMLKEADSQELASAFEEHLQQTEEHIHRLEQIFESFGVSPSRKSCKAMTGLLEEAAEVLTKDMPPNVRDAMMIAAAQKVEHYEMATYGTLRTWAQVLGEDEAAETLQTTLDEEGETDHKLTEIAGSLNAEALEGENDGEGIMIDGEEEPEARTSTTAPKRRRAS